MTGTDSSDSIDYDFKLRERHPDFQDYIDRNEALSEKTRLAYSHCLDQHYGSHPLQTIDVVPAPKANAPVFVFIHGGFWRSLDKRSYHFTARPFLEQGYAAAHINYRLAPEATMAEIVTDVVDALRWIQRNASEFNGNPHTLFIAGHSAGGHLALMSILQLEATDDPLSQSIKDVLSISGLYDLNPIRQSYLQEELQFDETTTQYYSPLNRPFLKLTAPINLVVGGNETSQFLTQSEAMHEKFSTQGNQSAFHTLPNLNHFDIVFELETASGLIATPLLDRIAANTT